jgi:hypothetical protein
MSLAFAVIETGAPFHSRPDAQVLTLPRIIAHANPPIRLLMIALVIVTVATVALWLWRVLRARDSAQQDRAAIAFMSAVVLAAPLLGFTAAAFDLLKACLGILNDLPTPGFFALVPAFAEAAFASFLGLLAASIAAVAHGHLTVRSAHASV